MATQREQIFHSQARIDAPHLRAIESGVDHDFDVLAGLMIAGQVPSIIQNFYIIETGAVGNDAELLRLKVGGGLMIHYNASVSGSLLQIPDSRADEILQPTNPLITGSFTPNTTNYVGIDITRLVDDSTADTVQFLNPSTNLEVPKLVALAKTANYQVVVSTTSFSALPGVCPVAIVVTDVSNKVVSLTDARNLLFRLGNGGSSPSSVNPFQWPGGRVESSVGGDRSIFSFKQWFDAVMSRIWEVGGGENWYSQTADRNVSMVTTSPPFVSNGEFFEWDGTNLHWTGLSFSFNNSTTDINVVQNQIIDSPGLTDIADGECIYVDLDREAGGTIIAAKGTLLTLGDSTPVPGQRWVIARRTGTFIHVRDQSYPVGSSFHLATTLSAGTIRTTIDPDGGWGVTDPVAAGIDMFGPTGYTATAGGVSHNADWAGSTVVGNGDLFIGRGLAAGDNNIIIFTDDNLYSTVINGTNSYSANQRSSLEVTNSDDYTVDPTNRIASFYGNNGVKEAAVAVYSDGSIGMRVMDSFIATPVPVSGEQIAAKYGLYSNGLASPYTRDQFVIKDRNGNTTIIWQSAPY